MSKIRGIRRTCNDYSVFAIKGSYVCPKCKVKGKETTESFEKLYFLA